MLNFQSFMSNLPKLISRHTGNPGKFGRFVSGISAKHAVSNILCRLSFSLRLALSVGLQLAYSDGVLPHPHHFGHYRETQQVSYHRETNNNS